MPDIIVSLHAFNATCLPDYEDGRDTWIKTNIGNVLIDATSCRTYCRAPSSQVGSPERNCNSDRGCSWCWLLSAPNCDESDDVHLTFYMAFRSFTIFLVCQVGSMDGVDSICWSFVSSATSCQNLQPRFNVTDRFVQFYLVCMQWFRASN